MARVPAITSLSGWELDRNCPHIQTLYRLAAVYGISVGELLLPVQMDIGDVERALPPGAAPSRANAA